MASGAGVARADIALLDEEAVGGIAVERRRAFACAAPQEHKRREDQQNCVFSGNETFQSSLKGKLGGNVKAERMIDPPRLPRHRSHVTHRNRSTDLIAKSV